MLEEILRAGAVHRDQVFLIVVLLNDRPDALVRRRVRRLRLGEPDADLPGVVVDINLHTGSPFLEGIADEIAAHILTAYFPSGFLSKS